MNPYNAVRRGIQKSMSLRLRLALWAGGLTAFAAIILLLFINITTVTTSSKKIVNMTVPQDLLLPGWNVSSVSNLETSDFGEDAGKVSPGDNLFNNDENAEHSVSVLVPGSEVEDIQKDVFRQMQLFSVIGLVIIVVLVSIGSYWMGGRALKPIKDLAKTTGAIDADNLKTHLDVESPDREVRQLSDSLDDMLDRLDSAFEQQGRFVADVAHELRTPLAAIRTNVDVVGDNTQAAPEDKREVILGLKANIIHLQQLIDDLLLMATQQRAISSTNVILESLLEESIADLEPLALEHLVSFKLESKVNGEGLIINGNGSLLTRVFHNLIQNAILYNQKGGTVKIGILRDNGHAIVTIADTGIGIPPEHLPNIFRRFYRSDSSRSKHPGGFGLGLSIVEHIVQLHGGRIDVESTPDAGSTFTVKLPLQDK